MIEFKLNKTYYIGEEPMVLVSENVENMIYTLTFRDINEDTLEVTPELADRIFSHHPVKLNRFTKKYEIGKMYFFTNSNLDSDKESMLTNAQPILSKLKSIDPNGIYLQPYLGLTFLHAYTYEEIVETKYYKKLAGIEDEA